VFSPSILRILIVVALSAHSIAHAIALTGLVGRRAEVPRSSPVVSRVWLLPDLGPRPAAAAAAIPFWLVATMDSRSRRCPSPDPHARRTMAADRGGIHHRLDRRGRSSQAAGQARRTRSVGPEHQHRHDHEHAILVSQLWLTWPAQATFGK
jgi:hypothetical protein